MTDKDHLNENAENADWDTIARYVAGEGTPDERESMRRTLAANPARAALIGALDDVLRMPEPIAPTPDDVDAALASVLARREDGRPLAATRRSPVVSFESYRSRWRGARLRAAAAVLIVAGAGLVWRAATSPDASKSTTAVPVRFATAVGKLDSLKLPDGSRVLLGPGSVLTLAQGFGGSARELTLRGEARFDVVHDSTRPFIVHTSAASFRDVGTVFAVHSDEADGARVVVSSGIVAVEGKSGVAPLLLRAGDRATVAPAGTVHIERAAATSDDLAWTSGKLIFRDASVDQVTADLRRWFGIELKVDPSLASRTVTATFERAATTDVGRVIAAMLGGGLREEGDTLHIVAPPPTPSR
ncbi:MAG: putative anti-sigma factor [Gemmatimonadetes bacterium]|nr:putative anti-sigma factor [Gemmatimonadota bacterium]